MTSLAWWPHWLDACLSTLPSSLRGVPPDGALVQSTVPSCCFVAALPFQKWLGSDVGVVHMWVWFRWVWSSLSLHLLSPVSDTGSWYAWQRVMIFVFVSSLLNISMLRLLKRISTQIWWFLPPWFYRYREILKTQNGLIFNFLWIV